jgi:YgiT-type zinc finger domain-containing protein
MKTKGIKKSCNECGSQNLKTRQTVYPIEIGTRQLNVNRVYVRECMDCHATTPTPTGQEKISRAIMAFMMLSGENNISLV